MHTDDLEFEWDVKKEKANWKKHGVHFADAQSIFEDEQVLLMEDQNPFEQRLLRLAEVLQVRFCPFAFHGEVNKSA